MLQSICVYCGSKNGKKAKYTELAEELGSFLAAQNIRMVFGGGDVGLMGVSANACLEAGGKVTGVIPQHLVEWEVAHKNLTELKVVSSMHERKAIMEKESDAFVAIPGGLGTLDELFEILTWHQLGLHNKPVCIINIDGFFDHLLIYLKSAGDSGFISKEHLDYLLVYSDFDDWKARFPFNH